VEDIIDDIILSHFDLHFDYWQTNFNLAKGIHDYQTKNSTFWESERVVDIIATYLEKWQRDGLKDPQLETWVTKFQQDKWAAAREYWQAMYNGMCDAFQEGMNEPAHIEHGFIKK
jgi:hypothetical protein